MTSRINKHWRLAALTALALATRPIHAQTVLPTTYALPVSAAVASDPGFIWNVSEVLASEPNQLAWAELQLAGEEGQNFADPTNPGISAQNGGPIALGPTQAANPVSAPISFIIPGVINLSKSVDTDKGNFTPDDQMPGIPGTGSNNGTDNIAAEILTYLDLPAGTNTLGVNSDDGFRMTIGGAAPEDKFALNVGQFDGGRGAADTIFQVVVTQPGLYAARVLYENGGGDANIEWFTVQGGTGGTNRTLVNDVANGGVAAYYAVTVAHAYVSAVDPAINGSKVAPNEGLHVTIMDGGTPVASSGVSLILDGAVVSPVVARQGNATKVDYTVAAPWAPASQHSASIAFTDGSLRVTNSWSFTVTPYLTLSPSWAVTNADTSKPGFAWNLFANSDPGNLANNNERAEHDLSLQGVDATGALLPNLADPTVVGAAVGPGTPSTAPNGPIHFDIATTINVDVATNMPGSPSTDATTDGQAAEVLTYLSLPAGVVHMRIDSDDGFRLYSGQNPTDLFGRAIIAEHNDGTGPWDFSFLVPTAGVYPFRLVWENGTGGSHLIWYNFSTPTTPALVNDRVNGGFSAYRALLSGSPANPYVVAATPVPAVHQFEVANTNVTVVLKDGANAINDASITLTIDGKSVTPFKTRQGGYLTVTDHGAAFTGLQLPVDVHSATLTYEAMTGGYVRTQSWSFDNIEALVLPANPVVQENFDEYPEATSPANTVPPGWTAWNYTAENTPGWDLTDKSSDSFLNWVLLSATDMNGIEPGTQTYNQSQIVNGQPAASFYSGNVLWATSDGRSGTQAQFCSSSPFDLSTINNPVMTYSSIIRMSNNGNAQADGIEYSIDGGKTWNIGVIYVTIAYGTEGNIILAPDGSVDAVATLNAPGSVVAYWTDPVTHLTVGGDSGAGLAEPVTPALAPYIAPRSDNQAISAKIDGIRLPLASHQKDVRLRFFQLGNCSWWWGVDNLAFYDIAPPVAPPKPPHIDNIQINGGALTVTWSNGGTLQSSPTLVNPTWTSTGNGSGTYSTPAPTSGNLFYRVQQ